MTAAVNHGKADLRVEQVKVPEPGPSEALVEVSHCGVCGSDLHFILEGWGRPGGIHGHEWSGTVVAVGPDVSQWKVGDRVVGGPGSGCGECEMCRTRRPSLCHNRWTPGTGAPSQGAFARYTKSQEDSLIAVPAGLALRIAALTEPLSVAVHGVAMSGAQPGQRVLVSGGGPIGLLTTAVLKAGGVDDITVSEPAERRRQRALEVGAAAALVPDQLPQPPAMPMELVEDPFDVVIECSGNASAQENGLFLLGRAGTLVFVGAGMGRPRIDPNRILLNELVVTGSNEYWTGDFERSLELLGSDQLPLDQLIEPDDVALQELFESMKKLAAGEIPGKLMVAPSA